MKKLIYLFITTVIICLFMINISPALKTNASNENDSTSQALLVKNYRGLIGVFESENENPIEIFDIQVETLPQADRDALEEGFTVKNREELQILFEDFSS